MSLADPGRDPAMSIPGVEYAVDRRAVNVQEINTPHYPENRIFHFAMGKKVIIP
jgi:hypothetical protein